MKIETIAISKLKPAYYNPRKDLQPGDPEYDKLKKAIMAIIDLSAHDLTVMKNGSLERVKDNFIWDVIADKTILQFRRILAGES